MTLYVGLMSGTSMDGIDAALIRVPSNTLELGITKKYSSELKQLIDELINSQTLSLAQFCQINTLIGREFAAAVNELLQEAKVQAKDIRAIGSHGQTVCHDTSGTIPFTLQMGCAHTISSLTGITVVADFRTRDLVNGGQGAPFAPLYHQELFAVDNEEVAVVNIGGIANTTILLPENAAIGWDVGPGNCLMDAWINKHQNKAYDADGAWANQGKVNTNLLAQLLKDSFVSQKPPKSIGKEYYSLAWLEKLLPVGISPVDVQATLCAFTAHAIADSLLNYKVGQIKQLFLCGGGCHNKRLVEDLCHLLPGISVQSTAVKGVSPDFVEAMMFAWLAAQTINTMPVNLSGITGSKGLEILGAIYPILKSY